MKKCFIKVICIICMLILVSCKNETKVDNNETKTSESETSQDTFNDIDLDRKKSLEDAGIKEEVVDISYKKEGYIRLEITYPKLTSDNPIIQKALDLVNGELKSGAELFRSDYIDTKREELDEREDQRYVQDTTDVYVTNNDDKYLSLRVFTYYDYMGAHPGYFIAGYTFDAKTGDALKLYDIVKDKEGLRQVIYKWCEDNKEEYMLFDDYKNTVDSYVDERPLFEDISTEPAKLQFYINDGKMVVVFQTYDISPYAAGAISIDVPKELLK